MLCIETSTFLGSLQKFEGDAEEFIGAWNKKKSEQFLKRKSTWRMKNILNAWTPSVSATVNWLKNFKTFLWCSVNDNGCYPFNIHLWGTVIRRHAPIAEWLHCLGSNSGLRACEDVASDLGLDGVFHRVLLFPPPLTTGWSTWHSHNMA